MINGKAKVSRGDYTSSEDDNILVQGVAGDQNALGYMGLAYFEENKDKLKLVAIDDENPANGAGPIAPSEETVRNGTYRPLSRPIFIYVNTAALSRPEVQKFIEYYVTSASPLVSEVGYVPLTDERAETRAAAVRGKDDRHDVRCVGPDGSEGEPRAAIGRPGEMNNRQRRVVEFGIERILFACAATSVLITAGIIAVLLFETLAFLREVSIVEFLTGTEWTPLFSEKHFGVLPLVAGTALVSAIAMVVALPTGLLAAIYLSEYAPRRLRRW